MTRITENIALLQARIARAEAAASRPPGSVKLLAVSKKHPLRSLQEAVDAGLRDFGESFWQEAEPKIQALSEQNLEWHFIGRLQGNKTRGVAQLCAWVHTIDRLRVARRLSEQRPHSDGPLQVCIQVRLGDDPGRAGVAPEELEALATEVASLPQLQLRGLMCLPPQETYEQRQRAHFRRLREYLDALNATGLALDTLSMGMTADLEAAIAEGATIIRVGTALFGPRPD